MGLSSIKNIHLDNIINSTLNADSEFRIKGLVANTKVIPIENISSLDALIILFGAL